MFAFIEGPKVQILKWRFEELGRNIPPVATMHLRAFFPQEIPLRLALAGLELAARYGDFNGGYSPNQIYVAQAKGTPANMISSDFGSVASWRSGAVEGPKRINRRIAAPHEGLGYWE
ncbi:MAG: hypothetical protein EOS25_13145 [Mesorhizobium sp.]|uniref:hypothetical protein n=1 Tax=Mesorhizobium sp. TaxID=1871066 RepID=UPI000FE60537|nr:hypothetical protein [Mesorhizobium sp.]RWD52553.1 MAG: hypothetical protein EOS59_03195 [Mesorhizobium sp.]RWE57503.1 MAG: hypothetical protein EOS24_19360 [Mesorhizobium sp.]RWF11390.1 MAG: hypothetical protein EOS69_10990 [Mesorhizobium sp.]RWF18667.1 MAG: hypothetical protein EOS25_13145 [Mesorhizobium sp.]TIY03850.1 MAG: hypothetical protein E5V22_13360 [Mesorhizobium sp.]